MKKRIYSIIMILILLITSTTCLATTNQYIEFESGETDENAIYLESYEEYMDALKDVDEKEVYKEAYIEMMAEEMTNYDLTTRETVKARVLKVENTVDEYVYDEYGLRRVKYQPIQIQILEGEYKDKIYDTFYVLIIDSYENIKVELIKENQKINVIMDVDQETGEVYPFATTVDAAVDRAGCTIILVIITLIILVIYLGKNIFKLLPQLILLADIILLIFVPEIITGRSIIWLAIVTMILYLITDTAIKVGLNAKMIASIISTVAVLVVTTIGLAIFNSIANISGILYDVINILETFPKGTIDFNNLVLAVYMLIATVVVSDISCKVMNTHKEASEKESKKEISEYVANKILTVGGILLVTVLPKYLYMLVNKYSFAELTSSEMLTNEIVRILFLIISMALTTQVSIYAKKLFVDEKKV